MDDNVQDDVPVIASAEPSRCGYVALIGAPNVGKSTLINALVGAKVSIVTPKIQTTRALIRGIATHEQTQIIFVDTPGIFRPRRRLDRAMVTTAWSGAMDADLVALVVDVKRGVDGDTQSILGRLGEVRKPLVLILNKVDLVAKPQLLTLTAALNEQHTFAATFMISAAKGSGIDRVKRWFGENLPEGPWLFPADQLSDAPLRHLAAEVTREKLFIKLHEELPYQSTVETDIWTDQPDGSVRIEQTVYVARDNQRKIVLGERGQTIKSIGSDARMELAQLLERPVHLFLFVKVREKWADDPERYREMRLDFPTE
jgi:GTP-binding protein Era